MELVIKNKTINGNLRTILEKLKIDSKKFNLLSEMRESGDELIVTCPYHANGREKHPSGGFLNTRNNSKIQFGFFHCFACNHSSSLPQLVADFFDSDLETGKEWLYDNFGGDVVSNVLNDPIELNKPKAATTSLNENILKEFNYYHPYMWQRKLTKGVVDTFKVGYDHVRNAITFPVWDEKNNLKFITARSVTSKKFWIPKEIDKRHILYLLNFAINQNVPMVGITEAQIDALTCWGYNFPCCATLGGISDEQIEILNKSGIRAFITMFDNDEYGEKFTKHFNKKIRKDVLVYNLKLPKGKKDINDLSLEEFNKCMEELGIKYRIDSTKLENKLGGIR